MKLIRYIVLNDDSDDCGTFSSLLKALGRAVHASLTEGGDFRVVDMESNYKTLTTFRNGHKVS